MEEICTVVPSGGREPAETQVPARELAVTSNALETLREATRMLSEVHGAQDAKQLIDMAAAAEYYAKKAKLGEEATGYAHAIKIDAMRLLGGFLKTAPKNEGTKGQLVGRGLIGPTSAEGPINHVLTIAELGLTYKESADSQLLATIAEQRPEEFAAIKAGEATIAQARLGTSARPTSNVIVTKYTGDVEWYTPAVYVNAAREVLGGIDTDPASNAVAQKTVKAGCWYGVDQDGLQQEWHGTVFLNPPYAFPAIANFTKKLCAEFAAGHVTEAILLTNNSTDTGWWHEAAKIASAVCFTSGRINFYKADAAVSQPTNGQNFFYFGKNPKAFASVFSEFGLIFERWCLCLKLQKPVRRQSSTPRQRS